MRVPKPFLGLLAGLALLGVGSLLGDVLSMMDDYVMERQQQRTARERTVKRPIKTIV